MGLRWVRMDFESLLLLQDVLDVRLINGEIGLFEYEREWRSMLAAAGYTPKEYELGIDRRWDYILRLHRVTLAAA